MAWGITGWSGGPRTPVNYNLRAGEFRGMRNVNVFTTNYTIINKYGVRSGGCCNTNYNYDTCGHNNCGGSSTPKWMQLMMGIGMGTTVLGNILEMFAKKDNGVENTDGDPKKPQIVTGNDNPTTLDKLNAKMDFLTYQMSLPDELESKVSYDPETGKYKFNNQEFDSLDTLKQAVQTSKPQVKTPVEGEPKNNTNLLTEAKAGNPMDCIDNDPNIADIHGKFSDIQRDSNGNITQFTIEDKNSKTQYVFIANGTSDDGAPQFKCIKKGGKDVTNAQVYKFDGKQLIQTEGMDGFGAGIKTD